MLAWNIISGIIVNLVFLMLLVGGVALAVVQWRDVRRQKRLIRAAQNLEIGGGVTLYEGIRACFCEDGLWCAPEDSVFVIATPPGGPSAGLRVCPELGRIEVYNFYPKAPDSWDNEPEALIGCLIDAAHKQVTFRRT